MMDAKSFAAPIGQNICLNRGAWADLISQRLFDQPMELEKKITGDSWELLMAGRVDGPAANQLEVEVLAALRQGAKAIYVNLAQATFLCSAGLRVLLQYHRQ